MSDDRERCGFEKEDGELCRSPIVDEEHGRCPAHRPGGAEEMRERASRGGRARARQRQRGPDVLDDEELHELESHADAKARLDLICRAVLTGRITRERADPAVRSIKEWVSAHRAELADEKLEELEQRLAAIEAGGDGRPPGSWGPGA